jgi:uncharacterized protein (DUF2267 family)
MDEEEFYEQVADRAAFENEDEVLAFTHATLEVLSERISEGQARDMAEYLPEHVAGSLTYHHGNPAEFDREHFVERIADHDEVDADVEERDERVQAVLGVLADATGEEFEDLRDQLPGEFEELFALADTEREVEN